MWRGHETITHSPELSYLPSLDLRTPIPLPCDDMMDKTGAQTAI
jgi:hypothetical protein